MIRNARQLWRTKGTQDANTLRVTIVLVAIATFANALATFGQEWQRYQLTDFPPPTSVMEYSAVADSLGHVHHFLSCQLNPIYARNQPLYYMRTDFYGNVLTDTVRINNFTGDDPRPSFIRALGDGGRAWCVFGEYDPSQPSRGLYLTERDPDGEELMPPTLVGYDPAYEGWNGSAILDRSDGTIHVVGTARYPCYYSHFTTSAETLQWHQPIEGILVDGMNTSLIISPADGRPWASMYTWSGSYGYFLVVRFNEDRSQTTYLPLQGQPVGVGHEGFGMSGYRVSDFRIGTDTVESAYVRLDSTFQDVLEYRTLSRVPGFGTLKTDSAGDCVMIWSNDANGLFWAYRSANGEWVPAPTAIDSDMYLSDFSVMKMNSAQLAFTAQGVPRFSEFTRIYLYTYGFPANESADHPRLASEPKLIVYPNPCNGWPRLGLAPEWYEHGAVTVTVYNTLGQVIWTRSGPRTAPAINPEVEAASGIYVVRVTNGQRTQQATFVVLK